MTAVELPAPVATASAPTSRHIRFLGDNRVYWRLLLRGAVMLLITLGIYRFWLTTDTRRFRWGNTEIAGDALEYTGTARELLIGFLFAISLLVPIYALLFLAALSMGLLGQLSGLFAFLLLALLGQFAVYRARRYRLSRTVYRGVRFHQTGSGWRYAFTALAWWAVVLLTFGLAYPWALASLERLKMRNTYYGDLPGSFQGSGTGLFLRGFPFWLLVIGPFVAGIAAAIGAIDWQALAEAVNEGGSGLDARVESTNPSYAAAILYLTAAANWGIVATAVVYPALQALVLRWWTSGLRFGGLTALSHLRIGQVYRAYVRFLFHGSLFTVAIGLTVWIALSLDDTVLSTTERQETGEATAAVILVLCYVFAALGFSTIYQATVKLALWRLGWEAVELSGVGVLDHVKAAGTPSSAVGEGLADALHVGGL